MNDKSQIFSLIQAQALSSPNRVHVVGIDGPTASGKTILADTLCSQLNDAGIKTWTYRLDWTLVNRADRTSDLAHLKTVSQPFPFEGELHMRLDCVKNFLLEIARFNEKANEQNIEAALPFNRELQLEGLYSRELEGTCTGSANVTLTPGMVIFLEGHYTLRNELHRLMDLNILLLSTVPELLRRKVERVKNYRASGEAEDYFWRIDLPSFRQHLIRFGWNADYIVDNDDFLQPLLRSNTFLSQWISEVGEKVSAKYVNSTEPSLSSLLFSNSTLVPSDLSKHITKAVQMLRDWDQSVGRYLRTSLHQIHIDLEELAENLVKDLNESSDTSLYKFALVHSDSLHNVYYRKLPLTLGIGLLNQSESLEVALLANVAQETLQINVFWAGGHRALSYERKLGDITTLPTAIFKTSTLQTNLEPIDTEGFRAYLPTQFTVPAFLHSLNYSPVFTGKEHDNISAGEAVSALLTDGGAWVHRFALFSEIRFFAFCLDCCGIPNMQSGNYLISFRHSEAALLTRFESFSLAWQVPPSRKSLFLDAQNKMDRIVIHERVESKRIVREQSSEFQMRDGYLFSQFMFGSPSVVTMALDQLGRMLSSHNRVVRKRAVQFISEYFPGFTLPTKDLWSHIPANAEKEITLESFNLIGPTIMAEIYLWLALRDEKGAILAANVYDIRNTSIDASAFLMAAAADRKPIVIQISLNAIGQREEEDNKVYHGYLLPKRGAIDFVEACNTAARDLLLTKGINPPLYSLGLDHVSAEHDRPQGRAKRFFEELISIRGITHLVVDGSSLFRAETRSQESLRTAYDRVAEFAASLIESPEKLYLIDLEICAGEFNYVGNETTGYVPDASEMQLFVRCFQERLKSREAEALLTRPMLLAGNLGTTHHGEDNTCPPVERSREWRELLKGENIVSAVLHGTSKSHRDVLARATAGCHKVNVAGDFLDTIVRNLPEHLFSRIKQPGIEPKKSMALIRHEMDSLSTQEINRLEGALQEHAHQLMDTVHDPILSQMDENYFRYVSFIYTKEQVQVILEGIRNRLGKYTDLSVTRLADSTVGRMFSVSMIEVPVEETNGELSELLWKQGIRYFHVDAGDGKFISRTFSGIEKIRYLRQNFPNAIIHCHLMVENPHLSQGGNLSYIQQYAQAGCNAIAIHPRSIKESGSVDSVIALIRNLGCRPGIVIETSDSINEQIKSLISRTRLDWAIAMGVPIGYGGQLFQYTTINRIAALHEFVTQLNRDFLIECDGGLNLETLRFCRDAGAQIFSGWSIINAPTLDQITDRLREIQETLTIEALRSRTLSISQEVH